MSPGKQFQCHCSDLMFKLFLKHMPRCENPSNSRILHFCVVKMDLWSKFCNFKHLQKINEDTEWSKIFIRAMFWHYEYNKRFVFAKLKSCNFDKWLKCGRNLYFFSTVSKKQIKQCWNFFTNFQHHLKVETFTFGKVIVWNGYHLENLLEFQKMQMLSLQKLATPNTTISTKTTSK